MYGVFSLNIDHRNDISFTISSGIAIITNASVSAQFNFTHYGGNKTVSDLTGWGVSVGVSFSYGLSISGNPYAGIGGDISMSPTGKVENSYTFGIGVGASIAPIPYFQTRFGYTTQIFKTNLSSLFRMRNNYQFSVNSWVSGARIRKWNNFLEILIYRAGIRIIIYQNKRIRISRM